MFALLSALASIGSPLRAQNQARMSASQGDVSDRLSSRVAQAVAREWNVDTASVVLSWGSGSLGQVPDTAGFKLIGGDAGWFSIQMEPVKGAVAWMRVRAGVTIEQPIATRALSAGSVIGNEDLRMEPRVRWGPPAAEPDRLVEAGWVVKRPIAGGEPLEGFRVAPPPVVSAGKTVRILYNVGNVSVALEGVALNDAAVGQPVRVRTSSRVGTVAATAVAPGEARMN
jgi:flagella basal body P-ring formation protein FlgA